MEDHIKKQVDDFLKGRRELRFKPREVIIRGDDEPSGVYFLRDGVVKMSYINRRGSELTVNFFKPGTFFPMTWAVADLVNTYTFQSFTEAHTVKVPKEEFVEFLKSKPEILFDLSRRILVGLDGTIFNMRHLISGNSVSKVASILFMLGLRFGTPEEGNIKVKLPFSHQDLANYTGLARETVTIGMNKLISDGIIAQSRKQIFIVDMDKLRSKV